MEAQTLKPFADVTTCPKCGDGPAPVNPPAADPFFTTAGPGFFPAMVFVATRYCPGGQELESPAEVNPVHALIEFVAPKVGFPAVPPKTRLNICWGIGEEHLHKTCSRCQYEWLTRTKDSGV